MRALLVVIVLAQTAHARPLHPLAWRDICVFALGTTDEDRIELAPTVGTSIDGGLYRTNTTGFVTRYQLTDQLVAIADARVMSTYVREPMPVEVASSPRQSALSIELGVIPVSGKFAFDDRHLIMFDVIASAGPAFVERDDRAVIAVAYGVTLRAKVTDWLTFDLGIHDDYAGPWEASAGRSTARTAMPPPTAHVIAPASHDVEARVGFGVWLPLHPGHKCRFHCG